MYMEVYYIYYEATVYAEFLMKMKSLLAFSGYNGE